MTDPEKPKRVHKSAEQRREEILTVATRIFAERGYQVADMQAVADAAGVGKGTVYRYFPTKEALFTEALRFNLETLKASIEHAREQPEDPLEQLREGMRAYLLYFEKNPDLIELFIQERAEFRTECQNSLYFSYMLAGREDWVAMFERIAERHPVRDIDAQEWMEVCGDMMHGAVVLSHTPLPRRPLSERFDRIFDIYLHGILKH
ncbi:TetR/AcrR family transcriptional regulator [Marinimicrobium sp. LS-A18]|uniref:TetR/AcrR family transcriptional regulator n=1 Tax=Marinimicrobium sp. LS-A18 TaxID=1381596 RepID=UPI00046310BC|nr:TetR/AcrR family transcriptional regulator [Marinimicrobium sp. LS-A18]